MITKPTKWTKDFVLDEIRAMQAMLLEDNDLFFVKELTLKRGYSHSIFSEHITEFENVAEISKAYEAIKEELEMRCVKKGLKGEYNANILKFHMINNCGYSEKTEQNINVSGSLDLGSAFGKK